jgi:hypothetical protein
LITIQLAEGYVVIKIFKKDRLSLYEMRAEVVNELKRLFQSGRYLGGTECSNVILTIDLAAAPIIPFSTLAEVLPVLTIGTHLQDSGLIDKLKLDVKKIADGNKEGSLYPIPKRTTEEDGQQLHKTSNGQVEQSASL